MYEMKLHDIGEGMTEGEVVHLLVKPGDVVAVDQPVMEVQTDKVTAELPCPVAGTIKEIRVEVGQVVAVGSTLLVVEEINAAPTAVLNEASVSETASSAAQPKQTIHKQASGSTGTARGNGLRNVMAAPFTRKRARELGVQIEQVPGTGRNGRITLEDVHAFAENPAGASGASQEVAAGVAELNKQEISQPSSQAQSTIAKEVQILPFAGRRKQIAQKMTQSMFTIPHVTHFDKIDMTELVSMKDNYQAQLGAHEQGQRLSIMAFIAKALAIALQEFPIFNAKLYEEKGEIHLEPHINLGVAVNTDDGLIVPVLPKVEELSLYEINKGMKELTKRALANELQAKDLRGGSFTISNVGPIGGMFATPIINHPEVALIAFHQLEDQAVVRNKEIVIRSMLNFSMSFDHRVADGVTAVQFTNRMKQLVEQPLHLFVHLK